MVPNKLTIENFKSYGTLLNPLDLNGVHIVCLSGQNGHGKSSLLDAICWAIWGDEVHRPQDELVKHGENDMRVELEFYSDGYFQKTEGRNLYKVIRRFSRRKGSRSGATSLELYVAQTREANTELDFQVLTGNTIRDTQFSIFKLVGMDYRTFINSAFLLQGRSDEFTNSTPALRQRTLGEILQLDYFDKLQELAREKIRELRSTKTTLELQINTLEEQVSRFTQEEIELNVLSFDLVQIEKNILEIQPLLENRKQDFLLIEEIETKTSKLLMDKKTIVDDLNIFNKQLISLQKTFSDYLIILEKREVINENFLEIDRIRNKLQQNNNLVGPYSSLTERKKTLENGLVRFNEIQLELVKLQENLISTKKLLDELQNKKEELNSLQLQIQEKNTHNDNLKNQMDDLKEKILLIEDSDQNCPLCGTELLNDRRTHVKEEFEKNGRALADVFRNNKQIVLDFEIKKESILDYIDQNDININNEFIRINGQIAAYSQEKSSLENSKVQLEEIEQNINELGFDPIENKILEEKLIKLNLYEDLYKQLSLAEKEIPEVQKNITDIEKLIVSRNINLETIDHEINDFDAKKKSGPEIKSDVQKLQNEFDNLLNQKIEKNARKLSIERQFEVYSTQKKELNKYENQLIEINNEYTLYDELSTYLGRTGVQALLIEASIPEIEKDANDLLEKMTNGEMFINLETQRQTQKGDTAETLDINVSDSRGMRSYETFSGGESFRINLALRIALSKLLARRAGCPLPTIFIDEGFGTQDNVGRERIIEVINQISSDFERVVVITHIEEIKEAFPVRIEVIKTESGSTFELN
ncbi:MAG: AAA family ATPase [Dehalococcoidia bacterium]